MDALGNVAKGAEEFAKEVVTEVRLSRHPQTRPFFDRFRLFLASKKVAQGFSQLTSLPLPGAKEKGQKTKASTP